MSRERDGMDLWVFETVPSGSRAFQDKTQSSPVGLMRAACLLKMGCFPVMRNRRFYHSGLHDLFGKVDEALNFQHLQQVPPRIAGVLLGLEERQWLDQNTMQP